MMRTIVAGFLGAVVIFMWGFLSWAVLPWHKTTTHGFSNEDAVVSAMKSGNAETGTYMIPAMPDGTDASQKSHTEKMKSGPVAIVHYSTTGYADMDIMYLLKGFLVLFVSATLAASLLGKLSWSLASKFGARVRFIMTVGLFLAFAGRLSDWAFLGYSTSFSLNLVADDLIGWTLAGLVIAWRFKPLVAKTS
ncbi:MAG: hypothetical protein Q8916_05080 [Bacteroidota bacterium]|nr:hypothetical protein [Bacteroidota bacterium]MDP4229761.1 hypothetical protein [Bacteroidota bacterium]MDP4235344.1 hypothetical protein [Bacteroidota bacterium]